MFKKNFRIFFDFILLTAMVLALLFYQMFIYGLSQAKGQLTMVLNSEPISEVLLKESVTDSVKQKLKLIIEIKQFAIDSLGINPSENYSTYYNQNNKKTLVVISASLPYELKAKEWTFPFLGTISYKGFFNFQAFKKEYLKLISEGYDLDYYSPSGWSTLGWFKDPVLSNMLKKNEGELANLIIHELTHGTLYVKNDVTFNENLANFIGEKGAEEFLKHKFGKNSEIVANYKNEMKDDTIYNNYILKSTEKLKALYTSFRLDDAEETKKVKKRTLIKEIVAGVNQLPLSTKEKLFYYSLQAFSEGNAFFMAFNRYDSQYEIFQKEYEEKFNANLKMYLNHLKAKHPSL